MTKGTKVFLGVGCGVLVIGAIVVIFGGYLAMNYIEKNLDESVVKYVTEGREYGLTTDKQGCITEGMRRSSSIGLIDLKGGIALASFVDACLETSKDTPNFCEGVPSFWSMKESQWGAAKCKAAGYDPEKTGCIHVTKRQHQFCSKPF